MQNTAQIQRQTYLLDVPGDVHLGLEAFERFILAFLILAQDFDGGIRLFDLFVQIRDVFGPER